MVAQARRRLFEFNTPSTRAEFARVTEAYLETVVTEQGASDFRVVCSEENNTALILSLIHI